MISRQRYQKGSLLKQRRADGRTEWVLRYRVTLSDGRRVQRQAVVGTTREYRTESQAQKAADRLRLTINDLGPGVQIPTVGMVARHFQDVELSASNARRSWSTKQNYLDNLTSYILPRWGRTRMMEIKAVEVEAWLATLGGKKTGRPLADPSRQKIRNVFSCLFTHAQRHEFVPQGHNPIKLVRQGGKRSRTPDILSASEVRALWEGSQMRERAMISIEFGNGLRISEAVGLKWSDIDFDNGTASVTRSVVKGREGNTKTEISRKLVPLHSCQLEDLKAWRTEAPYPDDSDWLFASHLKKGRKPYWPDMIRKRHLLPLAEKLGIKKRIGWHSFRRSYASLLKANREDIKVVQELMRHANISTTMDLYTQAFSEDARQAQSHVIDMVRKAPLSAQKPAVSLIVQ
ncbi:MAG: tyrosine-type recombinase/integrase [Acidobacteriaceae bacterium]